MSLARDPWSILKYREVLDRTGVLDRPSECLSDDEVVEAMERIVARFEKLAEEIGKAYQGMLRSAKAATAKLVEAVEIMQEHAAQAAVAEAEQITGEAAK